MENNAANGFAKIVKSAGRSRVSVVVAVSRRRLKIGSRVGSSTGVMVLFKIGLERRGGGTIVGLVAESSSGAQRHVIVVLGHAALALFDAPEDEGDTTQEENAADAADDTTNDFFVGIAEAATVAA